MAKQKQGKLNSHKRMIDRSLAVTFDVFDTLIHRDVAKPIDIFKLTEIKAKKLYPGPLSGVNLQVLRVSAERNARDKKRGTHGHTEVTLQEIYDTLHEMTGLPETLIKAVQILELQTEQEHVYLNPLASELLQYARDSGKKLYLCSDMYLSADQISDLLKAAGFSDHPPILVSSEIGKSKHEGNIFDVLSRKLDTPPKNITHFGDNLRADVDQARRAGIQGIHFDHLEETQSNLRDAWQPDTDWGSSSLAQAFIRGIATKLVIQEQKPQFEKQVLREIGRDIIGPYLLGKSIWLARQCREQKFEKVLFFARDAQIDQKIFQKVTEAFKLEVPNDYLYVSRASLLHTSLTEFSFEQFRSLISGKSSRKSVFDWLTSVGIQNPWNKIDLIRSAGLSNPAAIITGGDERLHQLLCLTYPEILLSAQKKRRAASQYLSSKIGDATKIAIVDIGWQGNMQAAFSRITRSSKPNIEIHGYYSGTLHNTPHNIGTHGQSTGYFCNNGMPQEFANAITAGGAEILEFSHMANHGTTLGYSDIDGTAQPELEPYDPDKCPNFAQARALQAGAMDFIDAAIPQLSNIPIDSIDTHEWASGIARLIHLPREDEANALGEIEHSDVIGHTKNTLKIAPQLKKIFRIRLLKKYKRAKALAFWPAGFKARNNFNPFRK